MILDGFKSKNVIKQFHKSLNKSFKKDSSGSDKINNILLFVENEIDQDFVKLMSENLGVETSNISIYKFKSIIEKEEDCIDCISKKDFGVFGKLKNESIRSALAKQFDLVICLTRDNEFMSSLVANSNTDFKVGLLDDYSKVYDLTLDIKSGDLVTFNTELKKYLEILNKV